jgi:hypothetical protein
MLDLSDRAASASLVRTIAQREARIVLARRRCQARRHLRPRLGSPLQSLQPPQARHTGDALGRWLGPCGARPWLIGAQRTPAIGCYGMKDRLPAPRYAAGLAQGHEYPPRINEYILGKSQDRTHAGTCSHPSGVGQCLRQPARGFVIGLASGAGVARLPDASACCSSQTRRAGPVAVSPADSVGPVRAAAIPLGDLRRGRRPHRAPLGAALSQLG